MIVLRTSTLPSPSDRVASRKPWTVVLSKLNERRFVLVLCCLAAIRVFVYSAAFPFFNNVDESPHFDLVLKYSHGLVPRKMDTVSVEASNYIRQYGSLEYYLNSQQLPVKSPVSSAPQQTMTAILWGANPQYLNHESSQAPLYYAAAKVDRGRCASDLVTDVFQGA